MALEKKFVEFLICLYSGRRRAVSHPTHPGSGLAPEKSGSTTLVAALHEYMLI